MLFPPQLAPPRLSGLCLAFLRGSQSAMSENLFTCEVSATERVWHLNGVARTGRTAKFGKGRGLGVCFFGTG